MMGICVQGHVEAGKTLVSGAALFAAVRGVHGLHRRHRAQLVVVLMEHVEGVRRMSPPGRVFGEGAYRGDHLITTTFSRNPYFQ